MVVIVGQGSKYTCNDKHILKLLYLQSSSISVRYKIYSQVQLTNGVIITILQKSNNILWKLLKPYVHARLLFYKCHPFTDSLLDTINPSNYLPVTFVT